MKLSWGTGITIAFICFAIFIGSLVAKAFRQKVDLVSEDYYSREIRYQDQLNKMNNTAALHSDLNCTVSEGNLKIQFPEKSETNGNLYFLRPSDAKLDVSEKIRTDLSGLQIINLEKFQSGKYRLQADWEVSGKKYYSEKIIVVP
jgi:hypothetical protein